MINILTFVAYYLPGYKAGGPIRSIVNMVDHLANEFRFRIVTSDRDFDDSIAYPEVRVDQWQKVGRAEVYYASADSMSFLSLRRLICSTRHDMLYLNSFFAYHASIKPLLLRRLGLIPRKIIIVAPRGEFSAGALGLKRIKKQLYLNMAKAVGLYRGISWQASSKHEETDIRRWFGQQASVVIAPNLPPLINAGDVPVTVKDKRKGCLKIIFLSRISRKKNLDGALTMLKELKGDVYFDIYGPREDKEYWAHCTEIIKNLPKNVNVRYCGAVTHEQVDTLIKKHDLFFLPTLGENFGHVILEALCAGCPVLISDQTPWRNLEEKGVGWDLSLNRPERFKTMLQKCLDMDMKDYAKLSRRALEYGFKVLRDDEIVEKNRQLFHHAR